MKFFFVTNLDRVDNWKILRGGVGRVGQFYSGQVKVTRLKGLVRLAGVA